MTNKKHTLKITGPIFNYEIDLTSDVLAKINFLVSIGSDSPQGVKLEDTEIYLESNTPIEPFKKTKTSRECLLESKASSYPEKILVIIQYLHKFKDITLVKVDEIKQELEVAREPLWTNFSRDLNRCIERGWIGESSHSDSYFVTNTGEEELNNKFHSKNSASNSKSMSKRKSAKRKPSSKTVIRDEILNIDFSEGIEDVKKYNELNTKSHQLLWILGAVSKNNITYLNQKEINAISEKLGSTIPVKSVSGLASTLLSTGYIYADIKDGTRMLKIEHKGKEYLKELSAGVVER